jgi:hypothetical protein
MTQTFIQVQEEIQALQLTQVIFDDSDLVSVKAIARVHNEIKDIDLLFSFKQFNDTLRYTGAIGDALQDAMSEKLTDNNKAMYIIKLEKEKMVFTTCKFKISVLTEEDNNVYCVDEVSPLSFFQQAKNLKSNIRDFDMGKLEKTKALKDELLNIAKRYRYYTGLLTLNINETEARRKSGLENDKLFQLAFMACH